MKRVSLEVIARELGISKTTVSMVLNGKGDLFKINADTQNRIIKIAQKYRYRPNLIARNLSQGKSMTLGLIVPNIADSYYSGIANYLENYSSKLGYKVLLGTTSENPKKEKELLLAFEAQQVDGILIASTQHNLSDINGLFHNGFPIVLFDRHYPEASLPYVVVDNYKGIQMLVEHMYECGRRSIGYIGLDLELTAIFERQRGYKETLERLMNQSLDKLHIVKYHNAGIECMQAVQELTKQGVDAIIFETHYLALHGIRKINELGLHYPEDVSIGSYGDHEVFSIFKPYVTAIDQPADKIATTALDVMMQMLETGEIYNTSHQVVEPLLIVRNS